MTLDAWPVAHVNAARELHVLEGQRSLQLPAVSELIQLSDETAVAPSVENS